MVKNVPLPPQPHLPSGGHGARPMPHQVQPAGPAGKGPSSAGKAGPSSGKGPSAPAPAPGLGE